MDHPTSNTPASFVESPLDCWLTPQPLLDLIAIFWPSGIDLDPFHDPASLVRARQTFDIRKGHDAYRERWGEPGDRIFANGPYSGSNPQKTAARCARYGEAKRRILSLCPAAPGSDYWSRTVWPWADAIAWCGRMSFVAGRDLLDSDTGKVKHKAGATVDGNRTEIALIYNGPNPRAFSRIFSRAYPVTVSS